MEWKESLAIGPFWDPRHREGSATGSGSWLICIYDAHGETLLEFRLDAPLDINRLPDADLLDLFARENHIMRMILVDAHHRGLGFLLREDDFSWPEVENYNPNDILDRTSDLDTSPEFSTSLPARR